MQVSVIDLTIIIVYFGAILGIGFYSMKKVESFADYAVAGRGIPLALLFATMAATATGGGGTIGRVAYAYHTGAVIFVAALGFVLNQVLSGLYIAPRMRKMGNLFTTGDVMGFYYGRAGRFLTGIFTFIYSVAIFGVQILAMGRILQAITGLPLIPLTIAASVITVLYTWAGGMWAVIYTDAVQFIVLALGITSAGVVVYNKVGGAAGIVASIEPSHLSILDAIPTGQLVALFIAFLFGEALAPFYVQRYLTAKDEKSSKWGVTSFGIYYAFYLVIIILIGLVGSILLPNTTPDLVMSTIVREFLPIGLVGIVFGAMISAIMSTGDSILNSAAVIYTRDIYQHFINKKADDRKLLKVSKATTVVVGIGGIIVALTVPRILDLLIITYGLWAPSIIPPLVIAVVWGKALERKVSPYAGPPAIIIGLLSSFVWGNKVLGEPMGIPAIVVGMVANIVVFIVVHNLTSKKDPEGMYLPEEAA